MKNTIKVLIADDHEIFRDGLKLMLQKAENIELIGEAADGKELIKMVGTTHPDVVITDIKMPVMDGVDATKHIKEHFPAIQVIALSMFDDEQLILEMLDAGALGYLLKNSDKFEITDAVETVFEGKPYYCKFTSGKLAKLIALNRDKKEKKKREADFSEKEIEIIKLICQEFTNKEIGEKVFLSARTVEGYRMKILEKMEAKNTVGIVIEAIRLGIYIPDEK
ncbi:MAG TPA: response regulator transcription factor [Flavipsychrobacter sp.]|nr:response regulator transcription factor [Flavipsychrobacter sp.]